MTFSLSLHLTRPPLGDVGPPLPTELGWTIDLLADPAGIEAQLIDIVRDMDKLGILPSQLHDNDNDNDPAAGC